MCLDIIDIEVHFAEAVWVLSKESSHLKEPSAPGLSCHQPTDLKDICVNAIHPTWLLKNALLAAAILWQVFFGYFLLSPS